MMTEQQIEKKLLKIESMVEEIHAMLTLGAIRPGEINWPHYDRAIQSIVDGDPQPLQRYVEQGGRIPTVQEAEGHHGKAA